MGLVIALPFIAAMGLFGGWVWFLVRDSLFRDLGRDESALVAEVPDRPVAPEPRVAVRISAEPVGPPPVVPPVARPAGPNRPLSQPIAEPPLPWFRDPRSWAAFTGAAAALLTGLHLRFRRSMHALSGVRQVGRSSMRFLFRIATLALAAFGAKALYDRLAPKQDSLRATGAEFARKAESAAREVGSQVSAATRRTAAAVQEGAGDVSAAAKAQADAVKDAAKDAKDQVADQLDDSAAAPALASSDTGISR